MRKAMDNNDFDPQKIYDDLIKSCQEVKVWPIRCILDEAWMGIAPFDMIIEDGVFTCYVVAKTKRDAFIQVADKLPVIKFLSRQDE